MTSQALAQQQTEAAARYYPGTWYLYATYTGWMITDRQSGLGTLVYTVN